MLKLLIIISITSMILSDNILDSPEIVYFKGDTFEDQTSVKLSEVPILAQKLNRSKNTVMYIFGYIENLNSESVKTIVEAYQQENQYNILVLNWAKIVARNYAFQTFPHTIQFSNLLANAIISMFQNGLQNEKFHIVAHSLGCQLASMTARNIKRKSKYHIQRISALDPAFPLFYPPVIFAGHLSKNDAKFVDVIHTDAFLYGAPISTGTIDFWINGGTSLQNGCPKRNYKFLDSIDLCSHWRSWKYWAESILTPKSFKAVKCDSWNQFKSRSCNYSDTVHMGIDCAESAKGNYYLQTNDQYPFARGENGIYYLSN